MGQWIFLYLPFVQLRILMEYCFLWDFASVVGNLATSEPESDAVPLPMSEGTDEG